MNRFHFLVTLFASLALLSHTVSQAEEPEVTYVAEMTGMVCAACRDHVRESFAKLPGTSGIEIERGDKPDTQKVTLKSKSPNLTKADAVKALGSSAETYVVISWQKAK